MSDAHARPPLPRPPVLVVGLGRAGRAAAAALAERLGPSAVMAIDQRDTPATRAAASELTERGVATALGEPPAGWPRPAVVVKSPGVLPDAPVLPPGVPVIDELELGWRLSSARVAAVTGTNGKGTTSWLLGRMLTAAGLPATVCGNFELGEPLSAAAASASEVLVVEASSFQLEATDSMLPDLAVFTNLGDDHRDRHRTRAAYSAAKRRLFVREEGAVPTAVLGADDAFARELARELRALGSRVITFGRAEGSDYRLRGCSFDVGAAILSIEAPDGPIEVASRLPGLHNALNAAGALAAAEALEAARRPCLDALATAPGVPGRFETIDEGQPFIAVADYAHNPDAYRAALHCARGLSKRKVRALIGVAGGMDRAKRPAMGYVAATLADEVFVTSSDHRAGESAEARIEELMEGARRGSASLVVEPGRPRAIEALVTAAETGDVIVALGRGAQRRPLNEDDATVFDDREALRAALRERVG